MQTNIIVQDRSFHDNKGPNLATSVTLTQRLLQEALRNYSTVIATEIHTELARRAPRTEAA